jgi:hypothetical protein
MRAFPVVRSCRIAAPRRVVHRARTVVAASKPEPEREPEPQQDDEEPLHFTPVPQSVALAILRSFIGLLDCIQKLGKRE